MLGVSLSALQPRIVADAFDTLVLAGRLEILRKFEELEKDLGAASSSMLRLPVTQTATASVKRPLPRSTAGAF